MSRAFIERAQLAASIVGGTATAANQVLEIAQLTIIASNTTSIDGKIGASAVPIDGKTNASAASGFIQTFGSSFNGTTWDRIRSGITAVSSTFTGFANDLPWAIFHSAPTVRADGQGGPLEADANGNLKVTVASMGPAVLPVDAKTNVAATSGLVQSFLSAFNGTTWDRVREGITTVSATFTGYLNTLPWAVYHLTPATRTDGQGGPVEADPTGNIRGAEQFAPVYEDNIAGKAVVEHRYKYTNIAGLATTVVESAPGLLHSITINKPVASSVITLYDSLTATGTIIGTITLPAGLLQQGPYTAMYDVELLVGLTVVTATAASDITISSRP
jgi:hypothetical protein